MTYIEFEEVCKIYEDEEINSKALDNVSFDIKKGEIIVVVGSSGSGKTTLLNLLAGIDYPSSGKIIVNKKDISKLKEKYLTKYRRNDIGFVFQSYNLMYDLTVIENIKVASVLNKDSVSFDSLLKKVGLLDKAYEYARNLTSEEKRRLTIARALSKNPKIILCDESLMQFDIKGVKQILKLLKNVAKKEKTTIIITTNNNLISPIANKIINLKNGRITSIKINKKPISAGDLKW